MALAFVLAFSLFAQSAFATPNPNITIVNPVAGTMIYSDNLLVSVKITTASSIRVSVAQEFKVVNGENTVVSLEEYQKAEKNEVTGAAIGSAAMFNSSGALSFYTKKVENVKPGLYRITVDTISADEKILFTNTNLVEIKPKEESADITPQESQPSGPAQFLKGLLKIIFSN